MNLKMLDLDIQLYQSQILLQADKTKISQILINLIINARDALESAARPIIRIRTDLVDINNQSSLVLPPSCNTRSGRGTAARLSDPPSGKNRAG